MGTKARSFRRDGAYHLLAASIIFYVAALLGNISPSYGEPGASPPRTTQGTLPRLPPLPPRIQDLPSTKNSARISPSAKKESQDHPPLTAPQRGNTVESPGADHMRLEPRPAAETVLPESNPRESNDALYGVEAVLTVEGQLRASTEGSPATPIKLQARLTYEEQTLVSGNGRDKPVQGVRAYQVATSDLTVADKPVRLELRPERRFLGFHGADGEFTLFSPDGPLTREEVDLLDVIGNSVFLDELLPSSQLRKDFRWEVPDDVLAGVLGLESVTSNTIVGRVTEATPTIARAEMSGRVQGRVMGATSQMEIAMVLQWRPTEGYVTALSLALRDRRTGGYVDGPFEGLIRLQLVRERRMQSPVIVPKRIATLIFPPAPEHTQLLYRSATAGLQITYDRHWYIITDSPDFVSFRLVNRRGLLGQCNLAPVSQQKSGEVTLAAFRNNVQQTLGQRFGQFVNFDEMQSASGHRLLRVHALGQVDDLKIHWIYYLLTSPSGRSYAAVFTVDEMSWPLFGEADRDFINGFHFLEPTSVTSSPQAPAITR